jgi:hypothetical protein
MGTQEHHFLTLRMMTTSKINIMIKDSAIITAFDLVSAGHFYQS